MVEADSDYEVGKSVALGCGFYKIEGRDINGTTFMKAVLVSKDPECLESRTKSETQEDQERN